MLKRARQCLHAGQWYTDNPNKLNTQLTEYLARVTLDKQIQNPKAIIAPHAGLFYSGPTAAWAYRYIVKPNNIERVFIFGPSHHKYFPGCTLTYVDEYKTPMGCLAVDTEAIQLLKKEEGFHMIDIDDEEDQHSIEMHLPFIVKSLGLKVKIVPIMCGPVNQEMAEKYGKIFAPYFDDSRTIFIFSTDFCHWGQRFQYTYHNKDQGEIWQSIEKIDGQGMIHLQNHSYEGFHKYINSSKNTICGRHPLSIFLKTIQYSQLKLKTKFVKYSQSEQVKKPNQSSVSYASAVTYIQE